MKRFLTVRPRCVLSFLFLAATPFVFGQVKGPANRYIVELNTEPVAQHVIHQRPGTLSSRARAQALASSDASAHRAIIRGEQDQVSSRVLRAQGKVIGRTENIVNSLIVEGSEPAQLAAIPGVRRVHAVRYYQLLLDRAVAIHKVVDAWNQIGESNAGAGIKIGIIDTGIDNAHAGFQDASLVAPDGFPKYNNKSDASYTSNKVIVARSYVNLLDTDVDYSPADHVGHGTALAMVSAGVRVTAPLATIEGVAPRAYLGNYKVFGTPGYNKGTSDAAIIKAVDDAVADGMDVINLSIGSPEAPRLGDDIEVQALEAAVQAGVIVVVAAGNNGTDANTIATPASAPSVITAGASTNDRTFGTTVIVGDVTVGAIPGAGPVPSGPVSGPALDVTSLDGNSLGCSAFPGGSLQGKIAIIQRGTCTFEIKLNNAASAGAVGAIVYTTAAAPTPFPMAVSTATLPAMMVDNASGVAFAQKATADASIIATLNFTLGAVPRTANLITSFSAAGPNVDLGIKPDVMAVGQDMYMATQILDSNGEMFDPSGYVLAGGTSFSSPLVAGSAALVKAARPGLTVTQYRSLLINTAGSLAVDPIPTVQRTGAGLLNVFAALNSPIALSPVSFSFGSDSVPGAFNRTLTITNIGTVSDTFTLDTQSLHGAVTPSLATNSIQLNPGASVDVAVSWNAGGLTSGTYDGYITVSSAAQRASSRAPYWYAVLSTDPARVTVLYNVNDHRNPVRGQTINDAIDVRVTDASGLVLTPVQISASVVSGGGRVRGIVNYDADIPGVFGINVVLGSVAGPNVFRIQSGNASIDVTITGN